MFDPKILLPDPECTPCCDELLRQLIDSVPGYALILLDPQGHITGWTEGARRIFGYTEPEIVHQPIWRLHVGRRARDEAEHALDTVVREGHCDETAWRARQDGSRIWASVVTRALHDPAGRLVGFGQIHRDLSDRRETAKRYEESRQRYRSLFESNPNAIFSFDLAGMLDGANPAAEPLTGRTRDELLRIPFLSLVAPEDVVRIEAGFRRATRGRAQQCDVALLHRNGGRVDTSATVVPIRVRGVIIGVYAIVQDITERKRAEAQRERLLRAEQVARTAAEAADRAKSDFVAVMTHELRTPLHIIHGYTELLHDGDAGPVTEPQREWLKRIRCTTDHLTGMIEQILCFARIESGREDVRADPVDLCELARNTAASFEPLTRERSLRFHVEVPEQPFVRQTDAGKVRQILLNLLGNAVKFTEAGEVRVEAAVDPAGALAISVRDTGVGIAAEHLERIWDPFWQVESPLRRRVDGTGLGLGVTRQLVQLLGAAVNVASTPGEGSTFTVCFP